MVMAGPGKKYWRFCFGRGEFVFCIESENKWTCLKRELRRVGAFQVFFCFAWSLSFVVAVFTGFILTIGKFSVSAVSFGESPVWFLISLFFGGFVFFYSCWWLWQRIR